MLQAKMIARSVVSFCFGADFNVHHIVGPWLGGNQQCRASSGQRNIVRLFSPADCHCPKYCAKPNRRCSLLKVHQSSNDHNVLSHKESTESITDAPVSGKNKIR